MEENLSERAESALCCKLHLDDIRVRIGFWPETLST